MAILRFVDPLAKMKHHCLSISAEEHLTFRYGRGIRWTCPAFPKRLASEHTFHPHPLGNNDILWIDPLEISITVFQKYALQYFTTTPLHRRRILHKSPPDEKC
jgi:hypothetical protein